MLLSQATTPVITALPSIPPTSEHPYTGAQATGAARASLQHALDNHQIGDTNFLSQLTPSESLGSDTQSFGDSHASELAIINSQSIPPQAPHTSTQSSSTLGNPSSPIDPVTLDSSSAPIPSPPATVLDTLPTTPQIPTVAETGTPAPAEAANIGPAGGSTHELHQSDFTASSASSYQPAEEKRHLAATYSQQPVSQDQGPQATPVPYEAYEKETSRLEREERERSSQAGPTSLPQRSEKLDKDDELPPYQDN